MQVPRSVRRLLLLAFLSAAGLVFAGQLAEWGPLRDPLWTKDGRSVSAKRFTSRDAPYERGGASHCGWQGSTFIAYADGQYVLRVPENGDYAVKPDPSARLPDDAVYTGWHRAARRLWVSPGERKDRGYENIYIVRGDVVERWAFWPYGCA